MRSLVLALLAAVLVAAGAAAPALASTYAPAPLVTSAPAAAAGVKVVIIVGATGSVTSTYRSYADAEYAEAIKYTSNVVKVYSPDATWTAVQAAVAGASIVIYHGHGNGWPSPYPFNANYATEDGFGLNATAGNGDSNLQYYGEPSVSTLKFAPNAVVLLGNLCYASGNSEPGNPEPTLDVAKQRADNYGAGFLKGGAGDVIADGHGSLVPYIRALFTTQATLGQIWRAAPNYHGNDFSWASVRTPGAVVSQDPDYPTAGYYRSIVGNQSLTATDVTGAAFAPTNVDPTSVVVPGAASVGASGAALYGGPSTANAPLATLAAGTKLRVDGAETATGTAITGTATATAAFFQVHALDGSAAGYVAAGSVVPRDSTPPAVWTLTDGPSDLVAGTGNPFTIAPGFSEPATWKVTITPAAGGGPVFAQTGTASSAVVTWDGLAGSALAAPGIYTWTIAASDSWGNVMAPRTGTFRFWGATGATYTPIAPARILDTRTNVGLAGGFATGVPRSFRVAGQGGVPANAVAVTGNLTVTRQTSLGFVALTTSPTAAPSTSTLNFPVGDNRANGVTAALGPNGSLSALFRGTAGATTQLVFDVTGYFVAGSTGSTYVPVGPNRLVDTRLATGLPGALAAAVPQTFQVSGRGGVPAGATAVTVNVTVAGQTSQGFVALTPTPTATPATSTINVPVGDTRANNASLPLGPGGTLSAVFIAPAGSSAQLVVDVTGYFLAGTSGASFIPVAPIRILDTRAAIGLSGPLASAVPRTLQVAGRLGLPAKVAAVTGNVTVTAASTLGFVAVTPTATATPPTSTINFPAGDNRANGVTAPLGSGQVGVVFKGLSGGTTQLIFDVTGYFLAPTG